MNHPLKLIGVPGSPYSRKLRAVLRYRHIPHHWIQSWTPEETPYPKPPLPIIPVLVFPDSEGRYTRSAVDSTPLIRELERGYPGRSVIPPDPALAFLNDLLEDFADEWVPKALMYYRWVHAADADKAAFIIATWPDTGATLAEIKDRARNFSERQRARTESVVGATEMTASVIEASFKRTLALLDRHLTGRRFIFGERPSSADFAFYGQYTQLIQSDPTPAAIAWRIAPRLHGWCDVLEDASGRDAREGDWTPREALPESLSDLLAEVGKVYLPLLLANASAIAAGDTSVDCRLDGKLWKQSPFPYHVKCLKALRQAYARLSPSDREFLEPVLDESGIKLNFEETPNDVLYQMP